MKIEVLDHGFVELIETWGSDERIVEAARQSTQKGFLGWGDGNTKHGDERLLRHLWVDKHTGPFEFAGATFSVQAPIFVFREWHRHRTQSYCEASARYAPLPDLNYIPSVDRLLNYETANRQAAPMKDAPRLTLEDAKQWRDNIELAQTDAQFTYDRALKSGVPKELARLVMPVGRYSRMWATSNLRNWLAFLKLREAPNAQWEIQQYANVVHSLLKDRFPRTLALYEEE